MVGSARRATAGEPDAAASTDGRSTTELADAQASLWCQRAWSLTLGNGRGPWTLWWESSRHPGADWLLGLRGARLLIRDLPAEPAARSPSFSGAPASRPTRSSTTS